MRHPDQWSDEALLGALIGAFILVAIVASFL